MSITSCIAQSLRHLRDTDLVRLLEMAYEVANGHVINVTLPRKVKLVTPIRLERNISKTVGARDSVP